MTGESLVRVRVFVKGRVARLAVCNEEPKDERGFDIN
jgi:hypothetical protein